MQTRLYREAVLIEGNDPRLIDVAILSKLPLGRVASHQTEPDLANPGRRIFGRDLLQVDVLRPDRSRKLLTLFNTHMKSNFVDKRTHTSAAAQAVEARRANARRKRQAIATREIIDRETSPRSRFMYVGDMNDDPNSTRLAPLLSVGAGLGLVDALALVSETRPSKAEAVGAQPGARWTSRHKESGEPPEHRLFDQIWVSPALGDNVTNAMIDRRTKHGGDGSDHDPAWITLTGL